jgi:hypothetical protein
MQKEQGSKAEDLGLGVSFCVAFSHADDVLATCGTDEVALWDTASRARRWTSGVIADPSGIAFAPHGRRLAAKATSGRVRLFDVDDGSATDLPDLGMGEGSAPVFSTDGRLLAHGSWSGEIVVVDVETGTLAGRCTFPGEMIRAVHAFAGRWLVVRSPTIAAGAGSGASFAWLAPALEGEPEPGYEIGDASHTALSPDGSLLAVARSHAKEIALVETSTGLVVATTKAKFGGGGAAVRFGGDLLGSVQDGRVEIYRTPSLERAGGMPLHRPSDVAFSADRVFVALGSLDDGIVIKLSAVVPDLRP